MTGACSTTPTRAEGHWSSATTAPTSASTTASTASPASPASTATTATALHWLPAPTLTAWGTGLQAKEGGAEERPPVPSHQATGQRLKGLRPTPTAPRAPPNSAMQNLRSAPCTTAFRRRIGRSQPHRAATDTFTVRSWPLTFWCEHTRAPAATPFPSPSSRTRANFSAQETRRCQHAAL